jgi:hypothetical protein
VKLLRLPTPSLVVAAVALSLAMGGVGYAAGSLPKNSVGSKQLKAGAVKGVDLKAGAVTGDKVADQSLTGTDLAAGSVTGAKVADQSLTGTDLAAGSVTGAQVDESTLVLPSAPGTVRVAGTEFRPDSYTTTFNAIAQSGIFSPTGGGAFRAQVPLPAGASVTGVRVRVLDIGADEATAVVRRVDIFDQAGAVEGPETSTVGTPGLVTLTPVVPAAVSAADLFVVRVFLAAGTQTALYGVEVDYR